ncbi:uL30 family ribosomal protein [Candidatus Woesearchaeota archaeon]|nr:uL30 family ribosomal protein [Candidatus Woesearchaeota archaeon]
MGKNLAVIRLRGTTGIRKDVALTLDLLNLKQINHCIIIEEGPVALGMLRKVKDYVTWGAISNDALKMLVEKRGTPAAGSGGKGRLIKVDGKSCLACFRLCPARGGLGKRGIKASFTRSGALGNRGEKISDLISRMV